MLNSRLRVALLCLGLIILGGAEGKLQAQEYGQGFSSLSMSVSHNRPFGEFAAVNPDSKSGFAKPGLGITLSGALQSYGERLNYGMACELRGHWLDAQHGLLGQYLEDAYNVAAAYQSEVVNQRQKWGLYNVMVGPMVGWHLGPLLLEGRFMIGRLDTGNPYYTVDNGNYVPPGWGQFFVNEDNETPWSQRRWNFACSPKVSLLIPFGKTWGWRLEGSMLISRAKQEMEVLDLVEENGDFVFQRRQERFTQRIRLWSIGTGIYMNFY